MQKIILLLGSALLNFAIYPQQSVQNNGNLQIHSGGAISCFGTLNNTATGILVNNGNLTIKGDLVNNESSMSAGSGTLYLNGSTAQLVTGAEIMKTNNLVTDNSAGITLNNNLSIAGSHSFTTGLIHTSATPNYLVYESGATHSGIADNRHVTGWVKKNGSDDFIFPVGDNTFLRSIAVSNLSASAEFNCHYFTPTQNIFNLSSPLVSVRSAEYWQVDKVSGGDARVSLNWDHSKVPMDNILLTDIRVGHYTGGLWMNEGGSASGTVTTTGSITSGPISSFSPITLAYMSFPIPLKIISFTGWRNTGTTFLHWVSENEQYVSHFSVERSMDGTFFSGIGTVLARNSGIREIYSYEDPFAFTGIIYYRLKVLDIDGKFSYSRVITVTENNVSGSAITVLNPVQSAITVLNKTAPGGIYDYQLVSSTGQLVQKGSILLGLNGASLIRLPFTISTGVYTVILKKDHLQYNLQILVEK